MIFSWKWNSILSLFMGGSPDFSVGMPVGYPSPNSMLKPTVEASLEFQASNGKNCELQHEWLKYLDAIFFFVFPFLFIFRFVDHSRFRFRSISVCIILLPLEMPNWLQQEFILWIVNCLYLCAAWECSNSLDWQVCNSPISGRWEFWGIHHVISSPFIIEIWVFLVTEGKSCKSFEMREQSLHCWFECGDIHFVAFEMFSNSSNNNNNNNE